MVNQLKPARAEKKPIASLSGGLNDGSTRIVDSQNLPAETFLQATYDKSEDQIVARQKYPNLVNTRKRGTTMQNTRLTALFTITAFLLGFGLGGLSMHYASAQGLFGVTASVKQIGSALVDMQKNIDELQKNMGTIKHAKEQLAALAPESGGDAIKKEGESLKKFLPGAGQ